MPSFLNNKELGFQAFEGLILSLLDTLLLKKLKLWGVRFLQILQKLYIQSRVFCKYEMFKTNYFSRVERR